MMKLMIDIWPWSYKKKKEHIHKWKFYDTKQYGAAHGKPFLVYRYQCECGEMKKELNDET